MSLYSKEEICNDCKHVIACPACGHVKGCKINIKPEHIEGKCEHKTNGEPTIKPVTSLSAPLPPRKEKTLKVTRDNYKQFKYLSDYRNGALEALTDDELKAQKFHLTDVYGGYSGKGQTASSMRTLKKIAMKSVNLEKSRRGIR